MMGAAVAAVLAGCRRDERPVTPQVLKPAKAPHPATQPTVVAPATGPSDYIIDIHQHTNYMGRTDAQLIEHQRRMGVSLTFLLPAGTSVVSKSTNNGVSNGLEAKAGGNESCRNLALAHPDSYRFGANEVSDLPNARQEIIKYLDLGAVIIGEQKFNVDVAAPEMQSLYELAAERQIPILMHFQYQRFNTGFEHFWKVLEKNPKTTFIGHAQTFWSNIDKDEVKNQKMLYPKTKVNPGGLTDQYLTKYPNLYADMSAGSGLNALVRDEPHAKWFLEKHQDKIIYGSDCADKIGRGPVCQGWLTIQELKKLASTDVQRKIFSGNAKKLFRLKREDVKK